MSRLDANTVRLSAKGKWLDILSKCGVEKGLLTKKGSACPICQDGEDRFTFDDKDGRGTWICRSCGAGDGFKLLQMVKGWDFTKALREVAEMAGEARSIAIRSGPSTDEVLAEMREIWRSGKPLAEVEAVRRWWDRRAGFIPDCPDLRAVRSLRCTGHADMPAMVALVRDAKGAVINMHRTYLRGDGQKPDGMADNRRVMPMPMPDGCAVRLSPAAAHMGIAEGIETAVACRAMFGVPTWAGLNARNMSHFVPPPEVQRLTIYGDLDGSYTGQAASFELARALTAKRKQWTPHLVVEVKVYGLTVEPNAWDRDWDDLLMKKLEAERSVAGASTQAEYAA